MVLLDIFKLGVTDTEAVKKTSMTVAERILNILHEVAQQRTFLHDYTYEIIYFSIVIYVIENVNRS